MCFVVQDRLTSLQSFALKSDESAAKQCHGGDRSLSARIMAVREYRMLKALVVAEYLSLDIQDPGSLLLERIELLASVTWRQSIAWMATPDFICRSMILEEAHHSSDREDPIGGALMPRLLPCCILRYLRSWSAPSNQTTCSPSPSALA
jgi:hypothetical protein